jgi:hypothetical protein
VATNDFWAFCRAPRVKILWQNSKIIAASSTLEPNAIKNKHFRAGSQLSIWSQLSAAGGLKHITTQGKKIREESLWDSLISNSSELRHCFRLNIQGRNIAFEIDFF